MDDIIIGSGTEDMTEDELIVAREKDLRRVLSELDKHNMVCKPTKASLFVEEVEFAGHVVGHGQRRPMPGKLASLHHWETPQTISELRSFMGFCNYYSGYVLHEGYATPPPSPLFGSWVFTPFEAWCFCRMAVHGDSNSY